jgi:alpha-tubulin suppressor-like RCC1 family protein
LGSGVVSIAAGEKHTCALTSSGAVYCWGENDRGQLGDGTTTDSSVPVPVSGLSSGVAALGSGHKHTCAVLISGGVKCWGHNNHGQLGDGSTSDSALATDVTGLTGAVTVAAGVEHSCALTSSGSVKCWGRNDKGQIGDGSPGDSSVPVDINGLPFGAWALAAGDKHTCSVSVFGVAHCWGHGNKGQLGDGATSDSSTPVLVTGISDAVAVEAGKESTCLLRQNSNVSCFGNNSNGQLGDGTTTDSATPVDVIGF